MPVRLARADLVAGSAQQRAQRGESRGRRPRRRGRGRRCVIGATRSKCCARRDHHRHRGEAVHEVRLRARRLAHHLDHREALQDLLPQDLQLQLGQAVADAAVDAEAEGQVLARPRAVDDEGVGLLDRCLVAVARDVPHHHLVALADRACRRARRRASAVRRMCASGVCQRMISGTRLSISAGLARSLAYSAGMLVQRQQAAGDRVARGVVAADDQQDQVAQVLHAALMLRVAGAVRQHRDQVVAAAAALTRSFHSRGEVVQASCPARRRRCSQRRRPGRCRRGRRWPRRTSR